MDPLQKLSPTPSSKSCCSVKFFKRAGVLLAFHLMNALLAIGGVIAVLLLLASMVLMPLWIPALVVIGFVMLLLHFVQQIPQKVLMYFGYGVLVVLYLASLTVNWYVTLGPYVVFGAGAIGVGFFFLSATMIKFLVKIDVHLANFVSPTNSTAESNVLDPDECMDRFKLPKSTDSSVVLPHILMTQRVWVGVAYFAILKVVVGVLSATVVASVVILPVMGIFGGSFLGGLLTFQDNPIMCTFLITSIWVVGALGASIVATLSVKLTSRICGEWKSEQRQQETENQQNEGDVAIPVTPEHESSTTSFAKLDPTTPVGSITAQTML